MAKKDIFKGLLNPEASPSRNAFDLSHRVVTSCKAGALVPILCEDTVPGDYFEISMQDMVRTMPLNTAAFLRAKVNYEFYFVPYVQLWHSFPDFVFQREDPVSSYRRGSLYQPNIQYSAFKAYLDDLETSIEDGATLQKNRYDALRLLASLGYGNFADDIPSGSTIDPSFSPFRLAAYQKIWNDYYRNPWRDIPQDIVEGGQVVFRPVEGYNFDDLLCDSYANSLIGYSGDTSFYRFDALTQLRYRGYKKDLFMGSLPEQQFGSISDVPINIVGSLSGLTGSSSNRWEVGNLVQNGDAVKVDTSLGLNSTQLRAGAGVASNYLTHDHFVTVNNRDGLLSGGFDVLALKQAEMMQLWKERTLRAGYRNQSQQKAHFGLGSRYYADEHPDFLGSMYTQIGIDEVISQADTSSANGGAPLGEIAGKGIGVGANGVIKYKADTFGIIMCLMSVVPDFDYGSQLLDKNVIRSTAFDYFSPEFENLGLAPITASLAGATVDAGPDYNKIIGFAPRYYEYKTRNDIVYNDFTNGPLSAWVAERKDWEEQMTLSGDIYPFLFYIDPANLDSMFAAQVASDLSFNSDQFIINLQFWTKAVRPMTVLGLPQW